MSGNANAFPYTAEDRRKHLDYVQAVITRLAQGSTTAKTFTLTIAAAAFGFSALNEAWYLSLLGIAVIACFSVLDMHYLYQERLFRCLFRAIVSGRASNYDMDKDKYKGEATRADTYASWSVLGFYLPLLIAGLIVVGIALATSTTTDANKATGTAPPAATPTVQSK